jgi:hypothetical protein
MSNISPKDLYYSNISPLLEKQLATKFTILDNIRLNYYYQDWEAFAKRVMQTHKEVYDYKDRYLIDHSDTDYYLPECPYGLTIFNLVRTCLHEDISMNTLIIVTNHIGLHKEFKILIPEHMHEHNFPTIIDQCFTGLRNTRTGLNQSKVENNVSDITKHGVSMMGVARIHRNILFNLMKEHDMLDDYAVSYQGTKK